VVRNLLIAIAFAALAAPAQPVRACFARTGTACTGYDIEKSADARAEFKRLGGRGVPLIVVGTEKMSGFSGRGLDALLARAGRRR
jgi:hypothetical protein